MIKQPNAFTGVLAVMVAAGCCGGLIVRSEKLLAQEPRKEKTVRPPDPWIGKKVVTKYGAPVGVGAQEPGPDRVFRVYTVKQCEGDRLQSCPKVRAAGSRRRRSFRSTRRLIFIARRSAPNPQARLPIINEA